MQKLAIKHKIWKNIRIYWVSFLEILAGGVFAAMADDAVDDFV